MIISGVTLKNVGFVQDAAVVRTGLQQWYDIGNTSSYNNAGATVYDLAGNLNKPV